MQATIHQVLEVEFLTPETFILHLERNNLQFESGQYLILRDAKGGDGREYSIYSSIHDERLSLLIREVEGGDFTRYLRQLKPGVELQVEGPRGFFILDEKTKNGQEALFIATGTGISPFHSYVISYPKLNYQMLHGVRFADEAYGCDAFAEDRYCLCASRVEGADYFGRVSFYLKENPVSKDTICYLCGNSDMIDEVISILENHGITAESIRTEVFF